MSPVALVAAIIGGLCALISVRNWRHNTPRRRRYTVRRLSHRTKRMPYMIYDRLERELVVASSHYSRSRARREAHVLNTAWERQP